MRKFKCPFCKKDIVIVKCEDEDSKGFELRHPYRYFAKDEKVFVCPIASVNGIIGNVVYDDENEIMKVWTEFTPVEITDQEELEEYWGEK